MVAVYHLIPAATHEMSTCPSPSLASMSTLLSAM